MKIYLKNPEYTFFEANDGEEAVNLVKNEKIDLILLDIEMDAILAVALGGNALSGGKFNIWGSVIGAYVIQFLTTTLFKYNVSSAALPAYKAVVVIILVILSAPVVREKMEKLSNARSAKAVAAKGGN